MLNQAILENYSRISFLATKNKLIAITEKTSTLGNS